MLPSINVKTQFAYGGVAHYGRHELLPAGDHYPVFHLAHHPPPLVFVVPPSPVVASHCASRDQPPPPPPPTAAVSETRPFLRPSHREALAALAIASLASTPPTTATAPTTKRARSEAAPVSPVQQANTWRAPSRVDSVVSTSSAESTATQAELVSEDSQSSSESSSVHSAGDQTPQQQPSQVAMSTKKISADELKPNDVLCGKGGKAMIHNRHFMLLCNKFASQYWKTNRRGMNGKRGIALLIVKEVQKSQGRFLKPQGTTGTDWIEIPDSQAAMKVAHAIRDLARKK